MRIALAGNPNSGKTTMYNVLTGRNEHVGNWAGVTVDKKEAPIKKQFTGGKEVLAVDLPGTYSMSPFTSEEGVTSAYVKNAAPDAIINIVDATNLSRSLFFTTQLLELGIPMVVALNKSDLNEKKQTAIDSKLLSSLLGVQVVETVSVDSDHGDMAILVEAALAAVGSVPKAPFVHEAADDKEAAKAEDHARFAFVGGLVEAVEKRKIATSDHNAQDRIDAVLTHPLVGLPIFALVMFLVFQISQAWVGPWIAEGFTVGGFEVMGLVTAIDLFKEWVASLLTEVQPWWASCPW